MEKNRQTLKEFSSVILADEEICIITNGNYIKYVGGVGGIKVRTENGSGFTLQIGGACKFAEFSRIYITNLGKDETTKTIVLGYGEIQNNAVVGSVGIDGSISLSSNDFVLFADNSDYNKTVLNKNCYQHTIKCGDSTSNYSYSHIINPVNSGVVCLVTSLIANSAIDGVVLQLEKYSTINNDLNIQNNVYNSNLNSFGEHEELNVYEGYSTINQHGIELFGCRVGAYIPYQFINGKPIVLNAGEGLQVRPNIVNTRVNGSWNWEEYLA